MWKVLLTKDAKKNYLKISEHSTIKKKAEYLLALLKENPFQSPPRYEKLNGNYAGLYSRRINIQHRLIYQVLEEEKIVKILAMRTHYE
jgi:Txe/YoeB family toxin of toxin-antitoxin system